MSECEHARERERGRGSRRRWRPVSLLSAAGALVATGLGMGVWGGGIATASSGAKPTLVVYSAQGYDKAETTAFQKATGIKVSLDDDSTGPLLTKVEAEKNNPKWGLLWVDGDTAFASLDRQHLLLQHWEPKVAWNSTDLKVVPQDHSYIPTGVTMAGTVVYDATKVSNPPTTWSALLKPQWAHKVGMNDPSISGPTYPFVAGMMADLGGVNRGEKYFTDLQSNGIDIHETNGDTLQALEVGQIQIAMIQSSAAIGATIKDSNLKVEFPDPVTAIPSAIGIDAKAPPAVQAEAKKFAEFVLSPKGQRVMQSGDPTGDSLYWPVIDGVNPLPALPALSTIPVQAINPYVWGARENTINSWFSNNIA